MNSPALYIDIFGMFSQVAKVAVNGLGARTLARRLEVLLHIKQCFVNCNMSFGCKQEMLLLLVYGSKHNVFGCCMECLTYFLTFSCRLL